MWVRRAALSLALLLLAGHHARPDEDDPEPRPSLARLLSGEWQQVSRSQSGQASAKDVIDNRTISFEKGRYVLRDRGQASTELTFVLDATKRPAHFDVTFVNNADRTVKGIVKYEKGELTVCMAGDDGERPQKFETVEGDGRIMASYKKKK